MKVVVAIDSFKGSLSSLDAARAAAEGIKGAIPSCVTECFAIADGGEGTSEALARALRAETQTVTVTGPLGEKVFAEYYLDLKTGTAVMEMSKAAGLTLVPEGKRDPLFTTTYGVGEMIKDAVEKGCRSFIIGIGGSATNDGGIGMLSALGFEFFDADGNYVENCGKGLEKLSDISCKNVLPELYECKFEIACDVTNPLCGKNGCSAVFAPQKGADENTVLLMDGWLSAYASLTREIFPNADPDFPGTGAAGGMGFAFVTYLDAKLMRGIDLVIEKTGIEKAIENCDIVVTGEGKIDSQTAMGKAPMGIANIAKKHNKPVVAFCGTASSDADICNSFGIDGVFPVLRRPCSLAQAMDKDIAYSNLRDTANQVFSLIKSIKSHT
ncbi:MAG: glycerate kinase [Ruminococcaceae bacterium]|nr:glycerate kinase [Oscillospiraceae bacterium]